MSIVTAERAVELITGAKWSEGEALRAFWMKVDGSRDKMAEAINACSIGKPIVAIVVRDSSFTIPNQILSDMQQLIESSRKEIEKLKQLRPEKLTIVILVKEEFSKVQIGSPITLPAWFPIRAGLESHFFLTDLVGFPDGALLNCPEAQTDKVAELAFNLECVMVKSLESLLATEPADAERFLGKLLNQGQVNATDRMGKYKNHISHVPSPRGYRPNASSATGSITSDMLRLFLGMTIDDLAKAAKDLATHHPIESRLLKPSYLGVALRPRMALTTSGKNWFAVLVGLFQAYQLMNASAHAGDYGLYPAALIHYSTRDLQLFLEDAYDLFEYN